MAGRTKHAQHSGKSSPDRGSSARLPLMITAVILVIVIVAGGAALVLPKPATSRASTAPVASKGTVAVVAPLELVATSPANAATGVPGDATLTVQLSEKLAENSPVPVLSPPVAGSWKILTPTTFTFVATAPFVPSTVESIAIPAAVTSMSGRQLGTPTTVQFTVAGGSTLRLQQLLASLNYLPLSFTATGPVAAPQEATQPQAGTFSWRWPVPPSLGALWSEGTSNVITQGAVMTFESQHGLATDGVAGPEVWGALLAAAGSGTLNSAPYNYVSVVQTLPETTTVYSNGAPVYSTPANTGVTGALTAVGTFPVYERFTSTTMSGTNPDGTKYHDPGIPWVSYFNGGDALHGFVRASYGFPQSDGCVEMPPANAAVVFPLTPIGTLVTVN